MNTLCTSITSQQHILGAEKSKLLSGIHHVDFTAEIQRIDERPKESQHRVYPAARA